MAMLYAVGRGVSRTRSVPVRTSFKVDSKVTVVGLELEHHKNTESKTY